MTPSRSNAFVLGARPRGLSNGKNLVAMLAAMRAMVTESDEIVHLDLEPMRAGDAVAPFLATGSDESRLALVRSEGNDLAELAGRLDITIEARFDGGWITLESEALFDLVVLGGLMSFEAALICGPMDVADVKAIDAARTADGSPLTAELQAVSFIRMIRDRTVHLEVRERDVALAFLAENFRHYVAAIRDTDANRVAKPLWRQLDELLARSGSIVVRPIETEVYSTAIDVGVCTRSGHNPGAADTSLIYDLHANTWHGD